MDTGDSFKPSVASSFKPAYSASKVDLACALSPKFEREIVVAKIQSEPILTSDGPPHKEMNRKFEVVGQSPEGVNFTAKQTGVPRGAMSVKLRLEEVQAKISAPASTPVKTEVLEEVILLPSKSPSGQGVSDAMVIERIERMMRAEQRTRDLEDENRVLTRTIARLQGEIDNLKATASR